jgi:ABC-type phosphate transport system auxiliary subunit
MVSIILKIDSLNHIKTAIDVLRIEKQKLEAQVKELEDTPRHRISHESFVLAQQTESLNAINTALTELVDLMKEVNSDFMIIQDVQSMISASQPYNAGTRENY